MTGISIVLGVSFCSSSLYNSSFPFFLKFKTLSNIFAKIQDSFLQLNVKQILR